MSEEEEETKTKGYRLEVMERIQNTPCARGSILHGAGGSVVAGLLHFLTTSRVKRSLDVGLAGFMLTTLGSWFYCRYNNAMLRVQQRMVQEGVKNKIMYEGTALDPERRSAAETAAAAARSS